MICVQLWIIDIGSYFLVFVSDYKKDAHGETFNIHVVDMK